MHWEKEFRVRITFRRIVIAIMAASTVANLVIVGAVVGAESPPTAPTTTTSSATPSAMLPVGTSTVSTGNNVTQMSPPTSVVIPTDTFAPTSTAVDPLIWMVCIKRFYWSTYRVQPGDRLFALALAAGSSVAELMAANCLENDQISAGQLLYVPHALSRSITPTDTATAMQSPTNTLTSTPTNTGTNTPSATPTATPTNTPTETPSPTPTDTPSPTPTAINFPPLVNIILPTDGSEFAYDGFDRTLNLWYSIVELSGSASDLEDDVLRDSALVWSTGRTDLQDPVLGNGILMKAILYSNVCSGTSHVIRFAGTDSQGQTATATIKVFIGLAQQC